MVTVTFECDNCGKVEEQSGYDVTLSIHNPVILNQPESVYGSTQPRGWIRDRGLFACCRECWYEVVRDNLTKELAQVEAKIREGK